MLTSKQILAVAPFLKEPLSWLINLQVSNSLMVPPGMFHHQSRMSLMHSYEDASFCSKHIFPESQVHTALNSFLCEVLNWESVHQKQACWRAMQQLAVTFAVCWKSANCATGCWRAFCQVQPHLPCQRWWRILAWPTSSKKKEENKEIYMLFSDYNGSLQRRQPGPPSSSSTSAYSIEGRRNQSKLLTRS